MDNSLINKLKWRSIRRSLLELDLIFHTFINNQGLEQLSYNEISLYEQLININDNDLLLIFNQKIKPNNQLIELLVNKILYIEQRT